MGEGTLIGGRTGRASKSGGISAQGISVSEKWAEFGIFLPLATYQAMPCLDLHLRHDIRGVVAGRVDAQSLRITRKL
jgi:hypothetical protein